MKYFLREYEEQPLFYKRFLPNMTFLLAKLCALLLVSGSKTSENVKWSVQKTCSYFLLMICLFLLKV